mgnify:CR=1 FL=1
MTGERGDDHGRAVCKAATAKAVSQTAQKFRGYSSYDERRAASSNGLTHAAASPRVNYLTWTYL